MSKGAIELQFNWIFVLITGIVIFALIISIAITQKNSSQKELDISILNQLTATIKAKKAPNTYNEIKVPETPINFFCDGNYFDYSIYGLKRELPIDIIYSPKSIESTKLQILTKDFSLPMTSSVVMYVTSPKYVYAIYIPEESSPQDKFYAKQIYDDFRISNISLIIIDENYNIKSNFKVICFENCPNSGKFIKVEPSEFGLDSYGNLSWYEGNQVKKKSKYIKKTTLYGAWFSEDFEIYECQTNRLFEQFKIKNKLINGTVQLYSEKLRDSNTECYTRLVSVNSAIENLNKIQLNNEADISSAYSGNKKMIDINKDLSLKSCPLLY